MKLLVSLVATAALAGLAVAADAPNPPVTIVLGPRQSQATPSRAGFAHTGGGNIDVAQPSPDTLVVTMSGVAVAGAHPALHSTAAMCFELDQTFDVVFAQPGTRGKLTIEGKTVGALRSHAHGGGSAQVGPGVATLLCGPSAIATLATTPHAVACGQNQTINDRTGPTVLLLSASRLTLHQTFSVSAAHPTNIWWCKAASSEFAPDPALNPLWISYREPFHGVGKKEFGFQVTIRVEPENGSGK
ncbi:MAG: hypothetical protein K1X57_16720 [Gemmataceae bacterium]|nr:hypothetical protein [Gemmataceae bacterium]